MFPGSSTKSPKQLNINCFGDLTKKDRQISDWSIKRRWGTTIIQSFMKFENDNVEVVLPRLSKGKAWAIEFYCLYPKTGKLERFKVYKGFKNLSSEEEKLKHAQKLIKAYSEKLKSGWRPWDQNIYIYKDEIEYFNVSTRFNKLSKDNSHIRKHLSDFLTETKLRVKAKTYESYQSKTRLFCHWLENNGYEKHRIFEISEKIVKEFFTYLIEERKLDRDTIEKYKQNLRQMFVFFKQKKLITDLPTETIVLPDKTKDLAARPIMDSDLKKLLKYIAENDRQMLLACLMQFYLCCRPGTELRLMKILDIDLYNNKITIPQANGKTGKRIITMPEALVEICKQYELTYFDRDFYVFSQNGKPGAKALGKNYFNRKFVEYRNKLKLPSVYKFYSFKHTGAGKLLESGATLAEVKSHLGHTSFESTLAYVKRHFGEKSEKIINFNPDVMKGLF